MKKNLFFLVLAILLSCNQTPKVEVEEKNDNSGATQMDNSEKNQEAQKDSTLIPNTETLKKDTLIVEKKEEKEKKEEEKKIEEKKKEEKQVEPEIKEPEFPDLPETDVYNPKEDPAPNEFVLVDREAKPKNLQEIINEIKSDAKLYGVKGKAVVGILVSTHGNYLKHYFFGVTNKKLEYIIADNIQNLKFRPATLNGEPVKMWYKTTIEIN